MCISVLDVKPPPNPPCTTCFHVNLHATVSLLIFVAFQDISKVHHLKVRFAKEGPKPVSKAGILRAKDEALEGLEDFRNGIWTPVEEDI
jgi:hypothetical protein